MPNPISPKLNKTLCFLWQHILLLRKSCVRIMLFLGFSSGLPLALVFGTLSVWLNEAGVSKSTITFFSWASLGYTFKFLWAPLIDQARLPFLTRSMGKRRSWLLLCQILLLLTMTLMAFVNPIATDYSLTLMAILAVLLGFLSASQDIVVDAYRIEISPPEFLGMTSAAYQLGYRLAMIVSGAFALSLSEILGSSKESYLYDAWQVTYFVMAALMLVGIITTLLIREPEAIGKPLDKRGSQQLLLLFALLLIPFIAVYVVWKPILGVVIPFDSLDVLSGFVLATVRFVTALFACYAVSRFLIRSQLVPTQIASNAYWKPVQEFINRYPAKTVILIMLLIGFYRISDIVLGGVANLFYQDLGFSKIEFSQASKVFGLVMTILGTFIGGFFVVRLGTMKTLLWGAALAAATNLLFMILAHVGNSLWLLYAVIGADNIAGGFATTAFITLLSRLSNIQFTAMQYAIFSSLMFLFPNLIRGYSGTIVEATDYSTFFLITTVMGVPVLVLVYWVGKILTLDEDKR